MSFPVTITGRLARDAEIKFTSSGTALCSFTVVTSARTKNDATGEWEDKDVTFTDCTAWQKLAENCGESLEKGMEVTVTGKMYQRSYENRDGEKKTVWEVRADNVSVGLKWGTARFTRTPRDGQQQQRQPRQRAPEFGANAGYDEAPPFLWAVWNAIPAGSSRRGRSRPRDGSSSPAPSIRPRSCSA